MQVALFRRWRLPPLRRARGSELGARPLRRAWLLGVLWPLLAPAEAAADGACCTAPPAITCTVGSESSCSLLGGTFRGEDTTCPAIDRCDCNGNGVLDTDDTALGPSLDCNANDVPDECELASNDANGNIVPDDCDPVTFAARQVLVVFRPEATTADISSLVASKGCSVTGVVSFVNEDTNDNGMLDSGEDTNGNTLLDKYEIRVVHVDDSDDEETTLGEFTVESLVASGSLNWSQRLRSHLIIPNDPRFLNQWSLNNIGTNGPPGTPAAPPPLGVVDADIDAPQAWEHSTGSRNVIVAVIDSGVDRGHPDLFGEDANANGQLDAGEDTGFDRLPGTMDVGEGDGVLQTNVWRNPGEIGGVAGMDDDGNGVVDDFVGASFTTNAMGALVTSNNVQDTDAVTGHGTHVAGIIGAIGNNRLGVAGVNWQVSLMPLANDGTQAAVAAAFRYAIRQGARVINFSAGVSPRDIAGSMFTRWNALMQWHTRHTGILNQIDALAAPGILVVNAAGYDGCDVDTTRPEDRNCNGVLDAGEDVNCNCALDPVGADNLGNGVVDAGEDVGLDGMAGTADMGEGNARLDCPVPCSPCPRPLPLTPPLCEDRPDGVPDQFLDLPVVLANPSLLTVTRSDHRDQFVVALTGAMNTNWGRTSVDVAGPGGGPGAQRGVLSTLPAGLGSYGYLAGTSQAAPHVAGIAAHFLSLPGFGNHTAAEVKTRILTGLHGPRDVAHPHGVDPRPGVRMRVASGSSDNAGMARNDGRARMIMGDDFGDAPDAPYRTLLARDGARHEDIGEEWLGRATDLPRVPLAPAGPSDVSPEFDATDNAAWPPDPDRVPNLQDRDRHDDGIGLIGPFRFSPPGGPAVRATMNVFITTDNNVAVDLDGGRYGGAHAAGDGVHGAGDDKHVWVNAFADWNGNGSWNDPNEHVFVLRADPSAWRPSHGGFYRVAFNMPPAPAVIASTAKRFRVRLDYGENLGQPLAPAPNGMVGPSAGGAIKFWDDPGGLPTAQGAAARNRYESIELAGPAIVPVRPVLDLTQGLAQFGEVEDYCAPDHYKCYKTAPARFDRLTRTLTDQFGRTTATVVRPVRFCNPVDKEGEGICDPTAHLMCYQISEPPTVRRDVVVENQFGEQALRILRSESLCVPAKKNLVDSRLNINHFKCYRVRPKTPFAPRTVTLSDQFQTGQTATVVRPLSLCTPVDKNGEGIVDAQHHITCYRLVQPNFGPQDIKVTDQFVTERNLVAVTASCRKVAQLCVPSQKALP